MNREQYVALQNAYLAIRDLAPELRAEKIGDLENGSPELAEQVQQLLAADNRNEGFLNKPLVERGSAQELETNDIRQPSSTEQDSIPKFIGPYRILQKIGEGGHGVVFMAEQSKPIRRKVAIKWVKPGLDSKTILARFEAERQALAMMNHPSIANVLDANSTESGQPYFVMELVHGVPIDQFCSDNDMSLNERLKLIQQVCSAVHHAHRKGIIHRDIKPGNVLVTVDSGKPLAKVIDFGIAKALHMPLTERTMFTEYGQIIGTLEYMSPEQALMSQTGIGIRSDVYSLGVLLYLLLTGETPLSKKELLEKGIWELTNVLKNTQPDSPSLRITSQEGSARWREHSLSPQVWLGQVRGDLDWVTMKALAKEPDLRYDTAAAFAADIQNYLQGDSVVARPPSTWYKFTKLVKRNRVATAICTSIVTATLISIAALTWGFLQSKQNLVALTNANKVVEQKAIALEKEKDRADQSSKRMAKMLERNILESAWDLSVDGDLDSAIAVLSDIAEPDQDFACRFIESVGRQMELPTIRSSDDLAIRAIAVNSKLGLLGTIATDSNLDVLDLGSRKVVRTLQLPQGIYTAMSFCDSGELALIGKAGGSIVLVDTKSELVAKTIDLGKGGIREIAFDPSKSRWYVTTGANFVYALKEKSLDIVFSKQLPERISTIAVSKNGEHVVTTTLAGTLFLMSADDPQKLEQLKGATDEVASFEWKDNVLAFCDWNGKVYEATISESETQAENDSASTLTSPKQIGALAKRFGAIDFASGRVFVAGKNNQIYCWENSNGRLVRLRKFSTAIRKLFYLDQSEQLLVAFANGKCCLISQQELQREISGQEILHGARHGEILANDNATLVAYENGSLKSWNSHTGRLLQQAQLHDGEIYEFDVNEQAGLLASVGNDEKIAIAKVGDLSVIQKLNCSWGVRCVQFSKDGSVLAGPPDAKNKIDMREGTVDLWDVKTGQSRFRLSGHTNWVTQIRFIQDGHGIVTLSVDGTAKIWSASTGTLIRTIELSFAPVVRSLATSSNDELFLGHDDGTISVWDLNTGKQRIASSISSDSVVGLCNPPNSNCLFVATQANPYLVLVDSQTLAVKARVDAGIGNIQRLITDSETRKLQIVGEENKCKIWDVPGQTD